MQTLCVERPFDQRHTNDTIDPLQVDHVDLAQQLRERRRQRLAGARVEGVGAVDGVRVALPDGFALWRVSGTEPVLRIYAEAASRAGLEARVAAARRALVRARP